MSNINEVAIVQFMEKIGQDKDFAEKVLATQSPEDVQKLANEAGVSLTMDDIMASKEVLYKALDKANQSELSDDELESVAGGVEPIVTATLVAAGIGAVGAIAAAVIPTVWDSIKTWKW
ncbi:Nif11-like leader peptide family natural product precursor [Desulfotomaculum sp. 1211_IL3151]|uniref:Nif11-like leader peptide family natural product precursor n=1 Tax=Desulfotomaculum sp. 1211_IL3151 TaxID=3084055 RepID=UPI002FDA4140